MTTEIVARPGERDEVFRRSLTDRPVRRRQVKALCFREQPVQADDLDAGIGCLRPQFSPPAGGERP